ncbi:hypothetical protein GGP57_001250 [Salinibacter ruber]|nr:hypothetical protein [Salinibacter ruber]MCS3712265.1 hypothetical protein [Salinibacter ruber]
MASDTLETTLTSIHEMTPRVKQFILEAGGGPYLLLPAGPARRDQV